MIFFLISDALINQAINSYKFTDISRNFANDLKFKFLILWAKLYNKDHGCQRPERKRVKSSRDRVLSPGQKNSV